MAHPNGFLGINTSEIDPIKGGIGERDLDMEHLYVLRTLKCSTPANRQASAVGIAMATEKTLHETAIKIFAARDFRRRWHRGCCFTAS
jgi:hypothetical protein